MKQSCIITLVFSKITIPEFTLKNVYIKPYPNYKEQGQIRNNFSKYFEEIDWSSDLAKVNGNIEIRFICGDDDTINCISLPVISCFLFTCTKGTKGDYKLNWSISMS